MNPSRRTMEARAPALAPTPDPSVPAWVGDLVSAQSRYHLEGLRFHHVTAGFDGAHEMDILTFQQRVVETYRSVFEALETYPLSHPVRFWAFIPGIHDDLGAGLDRYMAFNAGRYGAYATHFHRPADFGRSVPTASATGVMGDKFILHCLAASEPGVPVENPRQIPAYHYSRRFGPMPPCFARATLLRGQTGSPMLLVGGTASITGEDSRHIGQLEAQARETFRNLASLVSSAAGGTLPEEASSSQLEPFLATFQELRVYHPRPADQPAILAFIRSHFSSQCRVELQQASLCRSELLIEIEGVAFPRGRARRNH